MLITCFLAFLTTAFGLAPTHPSMSSPSVDSVNPPGAAGSPSALALDASTAYFFALPLVLVNVTVHMSNADCDGGPQQPVPNRLQHVRQFPTAGHDGAVVRSNVDTLYTTALLDLEKGPVVLALPPYGAGRYFLWQMMDAYTSTFASPSERINGTLPSGGVFGVCPPSWQGTLPAGMTRLDAPTRHVWMIGRHGVHGEDDLPVVHALQDAVRLYTLSGGPPGIPSVKCNSTGSGLGPGGLNPKDTVDAMPAPEFFTALAGLMATGDTPAPPDPNITAALGRCGIVVGQPLDWERDVPQQSKIGLATAKSAGPAILGGGGKGGKTVNGWPIEPDDVGDYGTDYIVRAFTAFQGLGANKREDAIYSSTSEDAAKQKLSSAHAYTITFEHGGLPPVNAFWSVTAYDANGYLIKNDAGKYAVSSWQNLTFGADGSLTLLLQSEPPGDASLLPNWLPTPADGSTFTLTARAYWPKPELLDHTWAWPGVVLL
jgi:hypothetical protein